MDSEELLNPSPRNLPSPNAYRGSSGIRITSIDIPFGAMVWLFIRAWFAWLLASFLIFLLIGVPILIVMSGYDEQERQARIQHLLDEPIPH